MEKVSFNSVYLGFAPACTPTRGGAGGTLGDLGQRGLSKEARWPRANLLSKAQEAHLHFYSVRLAWGRNTQRLATPESAESQRHCPVGCQQSLAAWGEGQKPAMPAGGLLPLPTRVPAGVPLTEAWPGSPPPARPRTSLLGGPCGPGREVLGGAPLGPQGLSCGQAGLPGSSGEFAKGWRARTRHLHAEFNSDSFEVVRGQPDTALWGTESALEFFFLFGGCTGPQSGRFLGDMSARREEGGFYAAKGAPRWISSPRGE